MRLCLKIRERISGALGPPITVASRVPAWCMWRFGFSSQYWEKDGEEEEEREDEEEEEGEEDKEVRKRRKKRGKSHDIDWSHP